MVGKEEERQGRGDRITRREFLRCLFLAGLGLGLGASGCESVKASVPQGATSSSEASSSPTPTEKPKTPTPTETPSSSTPQETPTPSLESKPAFSFLPTSMTGEIASRFLAGGEMMSDKELEQQFKGRVFKDQNTGAIAVLSSSLVKAFVKEKGITEEGIMEERWEKILLQVFNPQDPKKGYLENLSEKNIIVFNLSPAGKPQVFIFTTGENKFTNLFRKLKGNHEVLIAEENHVFLPPPTEFKRDFYPLPQWNERLNALVYHDGYQVRKIFDPQKNSWRDVLPHERRSGEYELLTPEQRMRKAMADLKSITGYDGSGVWTEGPKTVVDYTDAQGKKHHQELNVYFVHANQDPQSPIVYEVLQDPESKEMMFTIRASNHKDIKGLNEQQAVLVRQAWAYLLSADPQVMQKFWRVNKVGGVATKLLPENQASTGSLIDGKFDVIIFREGRFNDGLPVILEGLLGEGYEAYGAQYGWGEGWKYTNYPPDCLDGNMVRDAALRTKIWLEKYGKNLPPNVKQEALEFTLWLIGFNTSYSCQSQIHFEP